MQDTIRQTRNLTTRICKMKRRALENGIVIHYTFEHLFNMPYFQYFSEHISETGYRSDFFGSHGQKLTDEEVLEAFDIRANIHYNEHRKRLREDPDFRKNCASQPGQLTLAI